VDFDGKELVGQAKIVDIVLYREPVLNFDRNFGSVFRVQHRDVIDL
jgi:hypothetical protein